MKKAFLTALGLRPDVAEKIMAAHSAALATVKEKAKASEGSLTAEVARLKSKLETETSAYRAEIQDIRAQKVRDEVLAKVKSSLVAEGANPKALDLLAGTVNLDAISEGDVDFKEVIEPIKAQYGDFFGTISEKGSDIGTPPAVKVVGDPFLKGFEKF